MKVYEILETKGSRYLKELLENISVDEIKKIRRTYGGNKRLTNADKDVLIADIIIGSENIMNLGVCFSNNQSMVDYTHVYSDSELSNYKKIIRRMR